MPHSRFVAVGFFLGALLGAVAAFVILGERGNPITKEAYVIQQRITIKQGERVVEIPKGATVQMMNKVDGQPYYSLHFIGWPDRPSKMRRTDEWSYFFIERESSR